MLHTRPRLSQPRLLDDARSPLPSFSSSSRSPSPLLTLPPELLELIALHLATRPPNLGPPAALLPLLTACRTIYQRLGWRMNSPFWAKIGGAKFTRAPGLGYMPYEGYPFELPDALPTSDGNGNADGNRGSRLIRVAHALRARCVALSIIRRGDPHAPGAARALKVAYGMLVEDDWDGEEMDWTVLDEALGQTSSSRESAIPATRERTGKGKNRRQLAWVNAREFALRYIRERLYEGRFGDRDSLVELPSSSSSPTLDLRAHHRAEALAEFHQHPEWTHPAWRTGWPRDAEGAAAAMWVVWFFEGEETLRAEPEGLRRHLMGLLLPMVVAPFRYPSALAPPHHYTVPLLPAVYTSAAFDSETQAITVPTNHGRYPLYPLGSPVSHSPVPTAVASSPQNSARAPHRRHHQAHTHAYTAHRRHHPFPALPAFKQRPLSRLLSAPPARLLFFARMQVGARMGVPPHLPRDRAEAEARFLASGAPGPPPICSTQQDILEKNARPLVRFERQLPSYSMASGTRASTSIPASDANANVSAVTAPTAPGLSPAAIDAMRAVDPELGVDIDMDAERDERWAAHRWRGRLCRGYSASPQTSSGQGGAPGRIGRVYPLGGFAGLWAGTMLMPSEAQYAALISAPGGALPPGGLTRDDFLAAARPVYMRIREHWSFYPHHPAPPPPPDSTTADEGLRTGWLPPGTRVVGAGSGVVEVRVPSGPESAADDGGGMRRGEKAYTYHSPLDARAPPAEHPAHDRESCPGCVGVSDGARRRRERMREEDAQMEYKVGEKSVSKLDAASSGWNEGFESSPPSSRRRRSSPAVSSPSQDQDRVLNSASGALWPEWDAHAWAADRFNLDRDEDGEVDGWEEECDGVQDVVFAGETDSQHGNAWHHYEYAGRVRPWDGLIGLVMRPRDRTAGLPTYFISGHLVGRDTFEGTWQMAAQDVLAPSWGGSICLARGEE